MTPHVMRKVADVEADFTRATRHAAIAFLDIPGVDPTQEQFLFVCNCFHRKGFLFRRHA